MIGSFTGKYRWLSNFYHSPVTAGGRDFPTVEHAFQALKTFDSDDRETIQHADRPAIAKVMGKGVDLRPDWDAIKPDVMLALIRQKFFRHPELCAKLVATGDQELEEGNYHGDTYWGTVNGFGRNELGQILMQVRGECARLRE